MPDVSCPTCGERGKVPANLIGVRIKCRMCGASFLAVAAGPKPAGATGDVAGGEGAPVRTPITTRMRDRPQGIAVEGLDAEAWEVPAESAAMIAMPAAAEVPPAAVATAQEVASAAAREYRLLTSRDRIFDGKFDLARLEEALNLYAREGWVVKSMAVPHIKNFTGAMEEVVVVVLERSREPG